MSSYILTIRSKTPKIPSDWFRFSAETDDQARGHVRILMGNIVNLLEESPHLRSEDDGREIVMATYSDDSDDSAAL